MGNNSSAGSATPPPPSQPPSVLSPTCTAGTPPAAAISPGDDSKVSLAEPAVDSPASFVLTSPPHPLTPPRAPVRTSSAPPVSTTPSRSTSTRTRRLRPTNSSAALGVPPLHHHHTPSRPSSPQALCSNCRLPVPSGASAALPPSSARILSVGGAFCCKECFATWTLRWNLDGTDDDTPSVASISAALAQSRGKGRAGAGDFLNDPSSAAQAVPDSYVENRHEQIRRRSISVSTVHSLAPPGHDSPRSKTRSSTSSRAYACPALPSNPTTPHLAPTDPNAAAASEHSISSHHHHHPLTSPASRGHSSSSALQAMCVEEYDEELDTAFPSPPVRIPQGRPILSLKPFALPPPAQ